MKGVIIGTGCFEELARHTADRASFFTGLKFEVLTEPWVDVPHPSWLKLWVAERVPSDSWLIMDADMIPLRGWEPNLMLARYPDKILAAKDCPSGASPAVDVACARHHLRRDAYVNCGLLLFGPDGAAVLASVRKELGNWEMYEQTPVNIQLQSRGLRDVVSLPRTYNHICDVGGVLANPLRYAFSVNLHLVHSGGCLSTFERVEGVL